MVSVLNSKVTYDQLEEEVLKVLAEVYDPEIPVLSITDLGVVRNVEANGETVTVTITPTYSGCPAMDVIAAEIKIALARNGYSNVAVIQQLHPAWSSDWITEKGKLDLEAYGIAPPLSRDFSKENLEDLQVPCPQCKSNNTSLLSEFGSTACKALFRCNDCGEPFDYFKCH